MSLKRCGYNSCATMINIENALDISNIHNYMMFVRILKIFVFSGYCKYISEKKIDDVGATRARNSS